MEKLNYKILLMSSVISLLTTTLSFYPDLENLLIIPIIIHLLTLIIRNYVILYFILNYKEKLVLIFGVSILFWISTQVIISQVSKIIMNHTNVEFIPFVQPTFLNYLFVIIIIYIFVEGNEK